VPVRTVQVVEDSIDGKPLPEDPQPLMISLGRLSWQLFLSDANREKVLWTSIPASTAKLTAREVSPPIEVEMATWSRLGSLIGE
jgi:hypothetical protein